MEGHDLPGYNLDSIQAELRAKATHRSCPSCDGERWEIPGNRLAVLHSIDPDAGDGDPIGGVDLTGPLTIILPLVCLNCGFVRLHAPDYLLYEDDK